MGRNITGIVCGSTALLLSGCIPPTAGPAPASRDAALDPGAGDLLTSDTAVRAPDGLARGIQTSVSPDVRTVRETAYIVRPGDTLRSVGDMTGAGSDAIARANGLVAPFTIRTGQTLVIPGGRYHRVGTGQTGIAIARAYGVRWGDIATLNALEEPYVLRIGQRLALPDNAVIPAVASGAVGATPAAAPLSSAYAVPVDPAARAAAFTLDIDDILTGTEPAVAAASTAPMDRPAIPRPAVAAAAPGRFRWPLAGTIISRFGPTAPGKINDGVNIAVPRGTPVQAAADGVVAYAGTEIGVYGGLILISHGGGWVSAYGHTDRINVVEGQRVKAGDTIALSGESGQVQSPQLHFQLRQNRRPVDPIKQLPPR